MILIQSILILLLILLSAFFAGTETGVYRFSRFRLRIGAEQKEPFYRMLSSALQDGQGMILSLLLGNNLVNYLLTYLVTVLFIRVIQDEQAAGFYATAVLTPVLFVFGEMIPKNIFYYKADTLLPALAPLSWLCYRFFTMTGLIWLLKKVSRILSLVFGVQADTAKAVDITKRHQVQQIIHETQEEGLLSPVQREMISRLIDVSNLSVRKTMVPLSQVEMMEVNIDRQAILEHFRSNHHPRQIVYQDDPTRILGAVQIFQVLAAGEAFKGLKPFIFALPEIDHNSSVIEGINLLRNKRRPMALVTEKIKQKRQPVGIVTMADLIEEVTGELTT